MVLTHPDFICHFLLSAGAGFLEGIHVISGTQARPVAFTTKSQTQHTIFYKDLQAAWEIFLLVIDQGEDIRERTLWRWLKVASYGNSLSIRDSKWQNVNPWSVLGSVSVYVYVNLRFGIHQANGWPSVCWASFCGMTAPLAITGLPLAVFQPIQHVESVGDPLERQLWLAVSLANHCTKREMHPVAI